ncbi:FG-GAP repeat domain-containing protein [Pseudoalteromonas sp. T1lg23B]|uniref:FG-GAP repeat domain-containing protein n=1 Tax=Pseudoalteromonas sp. T1lg23B TaxID=2077097 RepID=UPI000CF6A498|nr:VCBS repeat-containing protein [Pseudoalteromonas sp. T1lg23B]
MPINLLIVLLIPLLLLGCGGSGGGSADINDSSDQTDSGSTPSPQSKIVNIQHYELNDVKEYARQVANAAYTGNKNDEVIDLRMARDMVRTLFYDIEDSLDSINLDDLNLVDGNNQLTTSINCPFSGNIKVSGVVTQFSLHFVDCKMSSGDPLLSGVLAAFIDGPAPTIFVENFKMRQGNRFQQFTGYLNTYDDVGSEVSTEYIAFKSESISFVSSTTTTERETSSGLSTSYNGEIRYQGVGRVSVEAQTLSDSSENISSRLVKFKSTNQVQVEINRPWVKYTEDSNLDGQRDQGIYFKDIQAFWDANLSSIPLMPVEVLSKPPVVKNAPSIVQDPAKALTTLDPIVALVSEDDIEDIDTSFEQFSFKYRWYINGELVSGYQNKELPAGIAKINDLVQVAYDVSDSSNTVSSELSDAVTIGKAPILLSSTHASADVLNVGELVEFKVQALDPDQGSDSLQVTLISAPQGGHLDQHGNVTWQPPKSLLFAQQTYQFTFGIVDSDGMVINEHLVEVTLKDDSTNLTARALKRSEYYSEKLEFVDVDGDGNKELLSLKSPYNLAIFNLNAERAQYEWSYPYTSQDGLLTHASSLQADEDIATELLLQYQNSIALLFDLNQVAQEIYSTENHIVQSQAIDLNHDGDLELVVLEHLPSDNWSSRASKLTVISLLAPHDVLFEVTTERAHKFVTARSDNNDGITIFLDIGKAYKAGSWQVLDVPVMSNSLSVADFNADGIDEIVSLPSLNSMALYSFVDRKLRTIDFDVANEIFQAKFGDIDNDGRDELIRAANDEETVFDVFSLTDAYQLESKGQIVTNPMIPRIAFVADVNSDGKAKFIFTANNGGEPNLVVYDLSHSYMQPQATYALPTIFDAQTAAGWTSIDGQSEYAVFTGGSKIATVSPQGKVDIKDTKLDIMLHGSAVDYDGDGFGELFVERGIIRLFDYSYVWQNPGTRNHFADQSKYIARDVNKDGHVDHVTWNQDGVFVRDVINGESILAAEFGSGYKRYEFMFFESKTYVVSIDNTVLNLYHLESGQLRLLDSQQGQECSELTSFNQDGDSDPELLCLNEDQQSVADTFKVYEIVNDKLVLKLERKLDFSLSDYQVDPRSSDYQGLLVSVSNPMYGSNVISVNNEGKMLWRSAKLTGYVSSGSIRARMHEGKLSLQLATENMMLLVN